MIIDTLYNIDDTSPFSYVLWVLTLCGPTFALLLYKPQKEENNVLLIVVAFYEVSPQGKDLKT